MTTPQERVDKLIEVTKRELGRLPTQVVVAADDWDWFAREAIKVEETGADPKSAKIKFDQGRLLYRVPGPTYVRIKRHR